LKKKLMKSLALFTILLAIILTLLPAGIAKAQETNPPTDDEVNAIAKQLYCPVCENIPLDVCGTQACAQWRELIREKLAQGWNEQQIKDYFVAQYGDRVLATPPARGLNWLAYIVPPVAILVGVFILYQAFRAWRKPVEAEAESSVEPMPTPDDEYVARLEEELSKR
jgi:cytochrome c-type biogenesis protein CcmH